MNDMTTPKELRNAKEFAYKAAEIGPNHHIVVCAIEDHVLSIQADALEWAAEQIKESNSLEEALMRLSIKHQELMKGKK